MHFAIAPEVVEIAARQLSSSSADVSENEEVFALDADATPQPPVTRSSSSPSPSLMKRPVFGFADASRAMSNAAELQADEVDEEDDDDDW